MLIKRRNALLENMYNPGLFSSIFKQVSEGQSTVMRCKQGSGKNWKIPICATSDTLHPKTSLRWFKPSQTSQNILDCRTRRICNHRIVSVRSPWAAKKNNVSEERISKIWVRKGWPRMVTQNRLLPSEQGDCPEHQRIKRNSPGAGFPRRHATATATARHKRATMVAYLQAALLWGLLCCNCWLV